MKSPNINVVADLVRQAENIRADVIQLRSLCKASSVEELSIARQFFPDGQLLPTNDWLND